MPRLLFTCLVVGLSLVAASCDDSVESLPADGDGSLTPPDEGPLEIDATPATPDAGRGQPVVDAGLEVDAEPSIDAGSPPLAFQPRPRLPPSDTLWAPRGYRVARGLIHMHSVFSHDACDGEPLAEDGTPNAACHARFRAGMCHNRHDFVLMTDHPDSVEERTLLEALYHHPGDRLEQLDGAPVANMINCPDGHEVLLTAGAEGDMMPVMFRSMPPPGSLRDRSPEGLARLRATGALLFQAHMERFDGPTAETWALDGQEIYNIHANLDPNGATLAEVMPDVARLLGAGLEGPHPDLWFVGIFRPGTAAMATWEWTIARQRMLGFAGSDTHENVPLPIDTGDGERIESYRRIGGWFSNRVLIEGPPSYPALREALVAGRLYVVFDALGSPDGFDLRAESADGAVLEMGGEADWAEGWRVRVEPPSTPAGATVTTRLIQVTIEGRATLAESTDAPLDVEPPGPGAYRVEVWVTPEHLRGELGRLAEVYVAPRLWIYSNPVYLR